MSWSEKYKQSIDCDNPKGFSQKAHCQGRKKKIIEQLKPYKTVEQIAKKHRLDISSIQRQLDVGEPIEHEHTKNHELAREIALQHLDEIPDYYTRLKKMEAQAKKHHKKFKDVKESILESKRDNKRASDPGYSLRDWFANGGWVQAGGKYDGKPCAKQPGQKTKPFCRDADDRAEMSKDEREKRARKKRKEDPNPNRKGKAKIVTAEAVDATPYGGVDKLLQRLVPKGEKIIPSPPKKPVNLDKAHYEPEGEQLDELWGKVAIGAGAVVLPYLLKKFAKPAVDKAIDAPATGSGTLSDKLKQRRDAVNAALQKNSYQPNGDLIDEGVPYKVGDTIPPSATQTTRQKISAAGNKYGKKVFEKEMPEFSVVEEKDACYNKVKSRYKVWPSAYASGALVKCRKVGAANWGTKTEETSLNYDWDTPIRERPDRYCPKCEKLELRSECKYGPKYWDMYSMPAEIIQNKKDYKITMPYSGPNAIHAEPSISLNQMKYNPNRPHPANESRDHEYSMARSELSTIIAAAKRLKKKMGKGEGNIEAWVQSKITKAADYIDAAADYVDSGEMSEAKKCWAGYKKTGTQKLFGKEYNRCVKEGYSNWREELAEAKINKSKMKCNSPKAQAVGDSLTGKSHVVKACEGGREKIIRFGQRGVKGSPKKEGESKEYASRRHRFQTRHAKNIAKGKMSAAYWANKVKW